MTAPGQHHGAIKPNYAVLPDKAALWKAATCQAVANAVTMHETVNWDCRAGLSEFHGALRPASSRSVHPKKPGAD